MTRLCMNNSMMRQTASAFIHQAVGAELRSAHGEAPE